MHVSTALWPISMAFGYILNAAEGLERWGVLLGAQLKEDVEDTHTHTHSHVHVESGCHGNPQQYYRINYWLVAGGVMLHRVSREGGRSMPTAEGSNIPNAHYIHGGSRTCHSCTCIHVICYFSLLQSADNKSDHPYMSQHTTLVVVCENGTCVKVKM